MASQGNTTDHKRNLLDEMEEQEERLARLDDTDSSMGDAGLMLSESSMDVDDEEEESSSAYETSTMATSEGDLFEGEEDEDEQDQGEESNGERVVEYEWTPEATEGEKEDRKLSALPLLENQSESMPSSAVSFEVAQGTFPGSDSFGGEPPRRSSLRRASYSSIESVGEASDQKTNRRITISIPDDDLPGTLPSNWTSVARRTSIREVSKQPQPPSAGKSRAGLLKNLKSHISSRLSSSKDSSTSDVTLDHAASSLGRSAYNAQWGDVAAAAAVVAADTAPKQRIQFFVGDNILAFLNILNHTNPDDSPESFSIDPVNKFGYPPGEGRTNQEQRGPYSYVLATVRRVHFDEDVPYYTVVRADTSTEQRCDAAWMEPITDSDGMEAALRAAQRTGLSAEDDIESEEEFGILVTCGLRLLDVEAWCIECFKTQVVPFYQRMRAAAKEQVGHMLYGDRPFACRMRFTGVNMLVSCSFVFLFLEQVVLAFVPARMDFAFTVVALIVWCILLLELILEWLIRPTDYFSLTVSDKAFAPSTQRYLDSFHFCFEVIALLLFIPSFFGVSSREGCGSRDRWTGLNSALIAVVGDTKQQAFVGRLYLGLTVLRIYGLIRHWRNMWLANAFNEGLERKGNLRNLFIPVVPDTADYVRRTLTRRQHKKAKVEDETTPENMAVLSDETSEEDRRLKKAATIGTALMVTNSHRALTLITAAAILLPLLDSFTGTNQVLQESVDLLYANNVAIPGSDDASCAFLNETIFAWILATPIIEPNYRTDTGYSSLLWAQVLPIRCEFQGTDGVITVCPEGFTSETCEVWDSRPENPEEATPEYYAELLDLRVGGVTELVRFSGDRFLSQPGPGAGRSRGLPASLPLAPLTNDPLEDVDPPTLLQDVPDERFSVKVIFDQNSTIGHTHLWLLCLNASFLILCLFGLGVLRGDADRLVLDPLQRMLKIVVRYAENPLSQTPTASKSSIVRKKTSSLSANPDEDDDEYDDEQQLGNYETEQLINAISKITDLLRKCWGVAGAGIISSNLARMTDGKTVGFNPTVPGKRIYALFGFVAIDGFSEQLRVLDVDVVDLINDVAKVVHDEVYRWSLGDSGQCNKNLGSAFLMVFRIGDFTEVHEKKARATDVVFSSTQARKGKRAGMRRSGGPGSSSRGLRRRRSIRSMRGEPDDTLQLSSLPGIQTFSDRALLGMLKSFAGIHRDKNLLNWKNDFRLSAGVGAFSGVSLIYGMDAGWAVEGAVGSAFKIDATYLSPHVNMASRMMSASKQYGVHILLSQAVEEILSAPARAKLRHLDTVYVKGSSVAQRVYTFDARSHGVNFFLYERTDEQEDLDAELYSPAIWNTDQDIRAMRQHVTKEFEKKFKEGKEHYLRGHWTEAVSSLTAADDIMIRNQLEEGYIDYNPDEIDGRIFDRINRDDELVRIRHELGDGACRCLIAYMERRKCKPPDNWKGVRPLTSK